MSKDNQVNTQPLQILTRQDALAAFLLTALLLGVYAFTAAPGITTEEDSGDFINGVLTLGIVHPPGYPLYTLLGYLFSLLPLGDLAYRVNLFSAFWGALCLGVLFLILRMLSIGKHHAAFAVLFLGFTTVFWSKTAIAEVYTFNAFLLAAVTFWILSYNRDKKLWQLNLAAFATGLALSNHYPLAVLSGVGLLFLLDRQGLRLTDFFKASCFLFLGLTPYLYLFIQAQNPDVAYNFGKLSTPGSVIEHILRKYYVNAYGGTLWDKALLTFELFKGTVTNFLLASVFIYFGLAYSFMQRWRYRYPFLLSALCPSVGLILILTFPSHGQYLTFFFDYLLPTFIFLTLFLAFGMQNLLGRHLPTPTLQVTLLAVLLSGQIGLNFANSSHHNDDLGEIWAKELLESVQPNSTIVICGPGVIPVYYRQLVKGHREDVVLYDRFSSIAKHNLFSPHLYYRMEDPNKFEIRKSIERRLINESPNAVYYTCKHPIDDLRVDFSYTPFLLRVDRRHTDDSASAPIRVSDRLLESLVHSYPRSDFWLDRMRRLIFSRMLSYYGGNKRPEVQRIITYLEKSRFYGEPHYLLSLANNLYYYKNYDLAQVFYQRVEQLAWSAFSNTDVAVYCNLLANKKDFDKALGICVQQEQHAQPCDANTVSTRQTIAAIYKEKGDWPKVAQYSRKILECDPNHDAARTFMELVAENPG